MTDPQREPPNYYGILGVASSATPEEIDRAYHRLASQYHPDVTAEIDGSADKFKSITEAHEILADPNRRRDYDAAQRRRRRNSSWQIPPPSRRGPAVSPRGGSGWEADWFDHVWGPLAAWGKRTSPSHLPPRQTATVRSTLDVEADLPLTPEEASRGGPCEFTVSAPQVCTACQGRPEPRTICGTCDGTGRVSGPRMSIQIVLPPGVSDGLVLRLPERGRPAVGCGSRGDLYLTIRVRPCW
jgi:curved DNA-binding protein